MSDGNASERLNRRNFLKVVGVSGAGVAAVGCSTGDVDRLIPYVVQPEDIVPGVPTFYRSTCRECPAGCGIEVETHEGRVTKVEGNPEHPISHGNLCARGQASVQGLYHPDRYQGPATYDEGIGYQNLAWSTAERLLADRIRETQAAGPGSIVFLTSAATGADGGSMGQLITDWVGAIGGRTLVYDPWGAQPRDLDFADADVLVSFGADFLETWGSPVDYARQFAQMRDYRTGRRGRFVWVAPHRPLTGLNADQWIATRPGSEALVALALAGDVDIRTAAREADVPEAVLVELAREFRGGRGVALGPGAALSAANGNRLQAAVDRLNGAASAAPATAGQAQTMVQLTEQMRAGQVRLLLVDDVNPVYDLPGALRFAEAMRNVPTRVSFSPFPDETAARCNVLLPGHHFLEAWGDYVPRPGVRNLVQPAMRPVFNTKQTGDVLLSVARVLGIEGIPANTFYDYLRNRWQTFAGADGWREAVKRGGAFPATGVGTGAAGFVPLVGAATVQPAVPTGPAVVPQTPTPPGVETTPGTFGTSAQPGIVPTPTTEAAGTRMPTGGAAGFEPAPFGGADGANFHLVVYPSYRFYDGRTANRPWLLELPDPVTKVSWGSWVEVHPDAARELGIEQGDVLRVASRWGSVEVPAFIYPGVRRDTLAIQMGLGHESFGRFTEGRGVNPNVLLGAAADPVSGVFATYGERVSAVPTGERNVRAQGLFEGGVRIQHDRELAQAVSLASIQQLDAAGPGAIPGSQQSIPALRGNGGFAPIASPTAPADYPPPGTRYGQYVEGMTRWAMAIDLSRCIGCSACVTACYAENNIPVVGPSEVKKGREMTWLRIERYFGVSRDEAEAFQDDATDDVRFFPMLCQHCGNAPCEPVCPVYAAYHTPDGLNGQVYNRCVGTRYCANNCPYKVRYFNWFTYEFAEPLNWQLNPDVTVREKGVMEKCTFCVQRIHQAERSAAGENRPVRDGEVTPACVQTCPTEVFVFGNIADPESAVARAAQSNRSYRALEAVNTQPAIVYLKKVTLQEPKQGGHHAPAGSETHSAEPAAAH